MIFYRVIRATDHASVLIEDSGETGAGLAELSAAWDKPGARGGAEGIFQPLRRLWARPWRAP